MVTLGNLNWSWYGISTHNTFLQLYPGLEIFHLSSYAQPLAKTLFSMVMT